MKVVGVSESEVGTEFLAYSSGAITNTRTVCARKEGNDVTLLI
jgi:hypothetical protein